MCHASGASATNSRLGSTAFSTTVERSSSPSCQVDSRRESAWRMPMLEVPVVARGGHVVDVVVGEADALDQRRLDQPVRSRTKPVIAALTETVPATPPSAVGARSFVTEPSGAAASVFSVTPPATRQKGYIELRKYVDLARDNTGNHVYLVDEKAEQHHGVEGKVGFRVFGEPSLDCIHRTEKAMTQPHAFKAAELCLEGAVRGAADRIAAHIERRCKCHSWKVALGRFS
jgi:hypothetical protein